MSNKKTKTTPILREEKIYNSYSDFKVTPKDSSQYYNAKEVKVEKILIKFK
jgi:hypothetical protein